MQFETLPALVKLPLVKQQSLQLVVRSLLRPRRYSIRRLMQVLGQMVASMEAVPFAQFHLRSLQLDIFDSVLGDSHHGCQSFWLGSGMSPPPSAGHLDSVRVSPLDQCAGNQSCASSSPSLSPLVGGQAHPSPVRQRDSSCLHQSPRRDTQPPGNAGGTTHSSMDGGLQVHHIRSPHPRRGKLGSGLSQPSNCGQWRVPASGSVSVNQPQVGHSGRGPNGIPSQQQGFGLRGSLPRSSGLRRGRSGSRLVPVSSVLRVSPSSSLAQSSAQDQNGGPSSHSHCPGLAQASLVSRPAPSVRRGAVASSGPSRPSLTRSVFPPEFCGSQIDGVALESWILTASGIPPEVISTMTRARKSSSAKIYHRTWKIFLSWCRSSGHSPWPFSLPTLLSFLQSGLQLGLSLNYLKGQVSALSVLFQRGLARLAQVSTFMQGASHIIPPYRRPLDPWDLNLVLTALQKPPFEPLREVSLFRLSQKVVFLVAITSLRRVSDLAALSSESPFLVFHQDKVVLRPTPDFLPKVVSPFHLN
ncbi:uncharacterized protein LOC142250994 [Anomaloglossus baeobatrachus]|uniref:uncharacterized protein LOC142250994 n=1 Tax=Anomaloglossus baeobatrachus TaxID=238106 RepID=UPI003F50957E